MIFILITVVSLFIIIFARHGDLGHKLLHASSSERRRCILECKLFLSFSGDGECGWVRTAIDDKHWLIRLRSSSMEPSAIRTSARLAAIRSSMLIESLKVDGSLMFDIFMIRRIHPMILTS